MPAEPLDVRKLLVWTYNAPVVPVWALASFLPVVGLFQREASMAAVLGEALFLATGLIGLGSSAVAIFLMIPPESRGRLPNPLKDRPGVLAIYTTIWLAAYAGFQYGLIR